MFSLVHVFIASHRWKYMEMREDNLCCMIWRQCRHPLARQSTYFHALLGDQPVPPSRHTERWNWHQENVSLISGVQCLDHVYTNSMPSASHMFTIEWGGEWWDQEFHYWILCLFLRVSQLMNLAHGFEQHGFRPPHRYPTAPFFSPLKPTNKPRILRLVCFIFLLEPSCLIGISRCRWPTLFCMGSLAILIYPLQVLGFSISHQFPRLQGKAPWHGQVSGV